MSKNKKISATEKLLDMIREEDNQPDPPESKIEFKSSLDLSIDSKDQLIPEEELTMEGDFSSKSAPTPEVSKPFTCSTQTESDEKPVQDTAKELKELPASQIEPVSSPAPQAKSKKSSSELQTPKLKTPARFSLPFNSLISSSSIRIGIDIQKDCINLAKLDPNSKILKRSNFLTVAIPEECEPPYSQNDQFVQLLKTLLMNFCQSVKKYEIWCSHYSENTDVHTIIIPKVANKAVANALFWATKKETEFDPAHFVFDYTVIKEIQDGKQKKIVALAYLKPRKELNDYKALFIKAGFPLTGLTVPSSAIHNLAEEGLIPDTQSTAVHFSITSETSYIDIYLKGVMLFKREIKTGINSFIESVFDSAADQDMILDDKSAMGLLFSNDNSSFYSVEAEIDPEQDELAKLLNLQELAVTDRLVRQLNRTFDYCSTNYKIPRASCLYTSGPSVLNSSILKEMESELGISCNTTDIFCNDPDPTPAPPEEIPAGMDSTTASGLAFSSNSTTQNFLFTYADKKRKNQENRINQIIAVFTIIMAIACGAFFFFQYQIFQSNKKIVDSLKGQLETQYMADPRTNDKTFAISATKKIGEILKKNSETAQRFKIIARINGILNTVPKKIKLTEFNFTDKQTSKNKGGKKNITTDLVYEIHGFVNGSRKRQHYLLLDFQSNLNKLNYVSEAVIEEKRSEKFNDKKIIYFKIMMKLNKEIF